jgi:hypothetical protein
VLVLPVDKAGEAPQAEAESRSDSQPRSGGHQFNIYKIWERLRHVRTPDGGKK